MTHLPATGLTGMLISNYFSVVYIILENLFSIWVLSSLWEMDLNFYEGVGLGSGQKYDPWPLWQ